MNEVWHARSGTVVRGRARGRGRDLRFGIEEIVDPRKTRPPARGSIAHDWVLMRRPTRWGNNLGILGPLTWEQA
jgi:hypothetical protein